MRGTTSAAAATTIRAVGAGQRQGSCDHAGGLRNRVRARSVPDQAANCSQSRWLTAKAITRLSCVLADWPGHFPSLPNWSCGFDYRRPLYILPAHQLFSSACTAYCLLMSHIWPSSATLRGSAPPLDIVRDRPTTSLPSRGGNSSPPDTNPTGARCCSAPAKSPARCR
jgi:hypothetical protein